MTLGLLVRATDPILRTRARDVGERPHAVVAAMRDVLATFGGVGLAAPQIGVPWRLFILAEDPRPYVNPVIVRRSDESDVQEEGCLSLPDVLVQVRRSLRVTVEAEGRIVELEGLTARVAQHEIDHLDGVLITDRAR